MPYWQDLTHLDFMKALGKTNVAVLVTGALEAHGHHLPLGTDSILPVHLTDAVVQRTNALLLPPIHYGDSWIFTDFECTVTVDPSTASAL